MLVDSIKHLTRGTSRGQIEGVMVYCQGCLRLRMEMSITIAFCFHPRAISVSRLYCAPARTMIRFISLVHFHVRRTALNYRGCHFWQYLHLPRLSLPHCTQNNRLAISRSTLKYSKCKGYDMLRVTIDICVPCILL